MALSAPVLQPPALPAPLLVVCLCAEWCTVCCEYRERFEQVRLALQQDVPQAQFLWIDVEDEAELLQPLDVDDFPTVLIAVNGQPRFFGAVTTQVEKLVRLVNAKLHETGVPAIAQPDVTALVARIQAAYPVSRA